MMVRLYILAAALLLTPIAPAQQVDREKTIQQLEKDGCVTFDQSKVKICKYDYFSGGNRVEAISFQPLGKGRFPGLLLIPGYQGSATNYITIGKLMAQQGFACLSVAQPGFGKSEGKPDFAGPNTIKALTTGFKKFQHEPYVDANKMGIFGYSRGGMAASLMAVRLKDVRAAVFGAGVYDFKRAYDDIKLPGIRENMVAETGMTEAAIKERSSILQMKKLRGPVLILHGARDENVPANQAILLRDRLKELKKDFEIKIFPDEQHGILPSELLVSTLDFFSRRLKGVPADLPKFR